MNLSLAFVNRCWLCLMLACTLTAMHALADQALADARPLPLARQGAPVAAIVLPQGVNAKSSQHHTATWLATQLHAMTGASLPIVDAQRVTRVALPGQPARLALQAASAGVPDEELLGQEGVPGETGQQPITTFIVLGDDALARQLGVTAEGVGPGGIRLKTVGNAVVLLGGPTALPGQPGSDANGLRHAAIELLVQLGFGHLDPSPAGQIIPRDPSATLPAVDITYTPPIRRRNLRWGRWFARHDIGIKHMGLTLDQLNAWRKARHPDSDTPVNATPDGDWAQWHRLGGVLYEFGHAGGGLRDGAKHLQSHPEWFAMQADGTRDQGGDARWTLCLANEALIKHVADDIIAQLDADPSIPIFSLDFNDGGSNTGWCLCEACEKLDPADAPRITLTTFGQAADGQTRRPRTVIEHASLSDRAVHYWNAIAQRVTARHPQAKFGISVYSAWTHPPVREKLHPNLVARYVPQTLERLPGWQAAGLKEVYWRPNILLFNRRHGKLQSFVQPLAQAMNALSGAGIRQTDFDSVAHHWLTAGVSYYAAARLNWDPTLSADALLDEYARLGFGPAATPIKAFLAQVEALSRQGIEIGHASADQYRYSPDVVQTLRQHLRDADRLAQGDDAITQRIARLRMGLNFTQVQETLDDLARRAAAKDATVDRQAARALLDLNLLMVADHLIRPEATIDTARIVWGTGGYAKWRPLDRQPARISDVALYDRLTEPAHGQTGREDSLADLFKAYGLSMPRGL